MDALGHLGSLTVLRKPLAAQENADRSGCAELETPFGQRKRTCRGWPRKQAQMNDGERLTHAQIAVWNYYFFLPNSEWT
jgi:hypothetical protein